MKFQGTHAFGAAPQKVFDALLDAAALQATIPGCVAAWWADEEHMKVRLKLPLHLPGLEGPYDVTLRVRDQQPPHTLLLLAERQGRIGGSVQALTHLSFMETEDGTMLTYSTQVDLDGPIAAANNPILQQLAQHSLNTFLKNLAARLES